MTTAEPYKLPNNSKRLERAVVLIAVLVLVSAVVFVLYYIQDRYMHSNESLVDKHLSDIVLQIQENPADPELRLTAAKLYASKKMWDEAITQSQEVLKLDPEQMDALILLGQIYVATDQVDEAINYFNQVVELNKDNEFAMIDPRMNIVYFNLGDMYYKKNDLENAITNLKLALEVDRTDADARYSLAMAYQQLGQHEEAIKEFNETLRFVPDFAEVFEGLQTSYQALGQVNEAAYASAMLAYTKGNYEQAATELESVIDADPEFDQAYLGLGLTYEKLGKYDEAVDAVHVYLKKHPDSLAALHALGRLDQRVNQ